MSRARRLVRPMLLLPLGPHLPALGALVLLAAALAVLNLVEWRSNSRTGWQARLDHRSEGNLRSMPALMDDLLLLHRTGDLLSDWTCLSLAGLALVAGRLAERVSSSPVPPAAALTGSMGALAAVSSLPPAQLGMSRSTWARGGTGGALAGTVIGGVYLLAYAVPAAREAVATADPSGGGRALTEAGLRIPLLTVLPEELAFRGVLYGLLSRACGARAAVTYSSLAFGLWHVPPALGSGSANVAAASVVGSSSSGVALRVVGTVAFTAGAGMVLAALRRRTDSLLAPALAHWAANGFGALFVAAAQRRRRLPGQRGRR